MNVPFPQLLERPRALEAIRPLYEQRDLIKVLTGMRRAGKSTLMKLIANDLVLAGKSADDFLFVNCEERKWASLDWQQFGAALEEFAQAHPQGYLFLDEVQTIPSWELAINSIRTSGAVSLFITGSNARLLSSDLATHLAGRYVTHQVYPLSFAEFFALVRQSRPAATASEAFTLYLERGGLPALAAGFIDKPADVWRKYLEDIYLAIFVRDIQSRLAVRQSSLFLRVLRYLFSEIGRTITASNLAKVLKEEGEAGSKPTILKFIEAAKEAFLFEPALFCDTQGKQLLKYDCKLYAADHGLREAIFGNNLESLSQILENIVFIELKRRGWRVSIGRLGTKEVDFIADKGSQRHYFQVSYLIATGATEAREFGSLRQIRDNFPKTVLSLDPVLRPQFGIEHRHLIDFLLDPDW